MAGERSRRKTATVPAVVREELELLSRARQALGERRPGAQGYDFDEELRYLRDALAEERLADDQAQILEQMDRLHALAVARARYRPGAIDSASPYFAHLRLETEDGRLRDLLLGQHTFARGGVQIVDWREAPIAAIYFRYAEGDSFVETIAGREVSGRVVVRRAVTVVDGMLVRVDAPAGTFLLGEAGWHLLTRGARALRGGAGQAARPDTTEARLGGAGADGRLRLDKHLPAIAALLDGEQYDLLTRDGEELLVVAGSAGSGKTTVGLHRLAYLAVRDPARFRPRRMLVLVFGQALARYISRVLPALGIEGVPVQTLPGWCRAQALRTFERLPRAVSQHPPASVVRFKTHHLLIPWLEEAAREAPGVDPLALFDELFTDRRRLTEAAARLAPGAFHEEEILQIHRWCTDQHFLRLETPQAVAGDEEQDPPCHDEEDYPILLRLQQLLRGPLCWSGRRRLSYDHLLVDEVQDFSPLELLVLRQAVRGASLTLAGDPAQNISERDFSDWSVVLSVLGEPTAAVHPLRVTYRSTRPIAELARAVLGPLAPDEPVTGARDGAPVELFRFGGMGAALTFLADALGDLLRREPQASVAVLARDELAADGAHAGLVRCGLEAARRVTGADFSFGPGIEVTDVAQTKGLEFDYVVLFGVERAAYPATNAARHLLHVGASRAIHQLWLLAWAPASPLLPASLRPRLGG